MAWCCFTRQDSNPHPKVIQVFLQQGCGCEIASGGEYAIATAAGASPDRIVFAGPGKGREELEFIISRGIGEIYLESVDLEEIRNAAAAGLADGVAFEHTASSADASDANTRERLEEISREFAFPICVPVGAVSSGDIYTEARELAKISDHVVVQIPLVEDSLVPMARLTAEGVVVCATFVYSAAQAIVAAKTGAAITKHRKIARIGLIRDIASGIL